MAHYLQAVALLAASSAAFNHKTHLDQKLACGACHAEAAASTRAEDNLLPKAEACKGCHAEVAVRAAPAARFVAKFNHAAHGKTMSCAGCHRLSEGAANPGFAPMAFCVGCHNKISPPDSCVKCHVATQELQPAPTARRSSSTATRAGR